MSQRTQKEKRLTCFLKTSPLSNFEEKTDAIKAL